MDEVGLGAVVVGAAALEVLGKVIHWLKEVEVRESEARPLVWVVNQLMLYLCFYVRFFPKRIM